MEDRKEEILTKAEPGRCPSCNRLQVLPALTVTSKLQYCKLCGAASKGYKWLARFKEQPMNFLPPKADR